MDELKLKEDELAEAVRQRALTSEEAERRVNAAREQAMPALLRMVQAMKALARTDAERLALAQLEQQIRGVTERVDEMRQTVVNAAQSGLATLWVDFVTGAKTAKEALRDFAAGFARTMLDLMAKRLAERLVNQAMDALEQMKTSGGERRQLVGCRAAVDRDDLRHQQAHRRRDRRRRRQPAPRQRPGCSRARRCCTAAASPASCPTRCRPSSSAARRC
ncbi:hypothetical protein MASR1M6_11780 [Rubrivivax sp.]